MMFEKHKLEKEEQAGQAIGQVEEDKLVMLRQNKHYIELERKFSRLHAWLLSYHKLNLSLLPACQHLVLSWSPNTFINT